MDTIRWVNQRQPQTLVIATFLLYFNAAMLLIRGGLFAPWGALLIALGAGGAFGVANEKKIGYWAALAAGAAPFAIRLIYTGNPLSADLLSLMFEIALLALLLHPQSRDYQRIWFK